MTCFTFSRDPPAGSAVKKRWRAETDLTQVSELKAKHRGFVNLLKGKPAAGDQLSIRVLACVFHDVCRHISAER